MPALNMVQGLNLALEQSMAADESVVVMGEDVAVNGGVFRVTKGLLEKFGDERVIDTPLAEAGIIGTAVGMALTGMNVVAEIQFSGFTYQAFHQIEQNMARMNNRSRARFGVPMVLRSPYGGGIRAVEHHSESREAYWAHTPGLKVVIPSSPRIARSLLAESIRHPDPVVFYEPKAVYRAFREEVPDEPEYFPIGKARTLREGDSITLISYGAMMRPTLEAAEDLDEVHGIQTDVIDLVSIYPMDTETLASSVSRTGRAIVVHEGPRTCGIAAEVIARINEEAFDCLEAPIRRLTGYDTHFPYFQTERFFLPTTDDIVSAAKELLEY